ncbi:MAG: cell division protein ZapA [Neolewinella sp.]|jgi:cell division protein ZapA
MKKVEKGLSVRILDKEYQIACSDDEREDLVKAARYLEAKLSDVSNKGKIIGPERAAIMAALNISYELVQANKSTENESQYQDRLEKLQDDVRIVVDKYKQTGL